MDLPPIDYFKVVCLLVSIKANQKSRSDKPEIVFLATLKCNSVLQGSRLMASCRRSIWGGRNCVWDKQLLTKWLNWLQQRTFTHAVTIIISLHSAVSALVTITACLTKKILWYRIGPSPQPQTVLCQSLDCASLLFCAWAGLHNPAYLPSLV